MTDTTTVNPGVRGHTRSTWRDETHLRGILLRLMTQYPDITRDELLEKYLAKVKGRGFQASSQAESLIDEGLTRAFDNDLAGIQRAPSRPRVVIAAEAAALAERVRSMVLLDLVEPNGKKLGDCTGAECRQFGGWRVAIADRIGDRAVVREKLSEAQVASIFDARQQDG